MSKRRVLVVAIEGRDLGVVSPVGRMTAIGVAAISLTIVSGGRAPIAAIPDPCGISQMRTQSREMLSDGHGQSMGGG